MNDTRWLSVIDGDDTRSLLVDSHRVVEISARSVKIVNHQVVSSSIELIVWLANCHVVQQTAHVSLREDEITIVPRALVEECAH